MRTQKLIDKPKAPESKPGAQPDSKADLKSLPMAELQAKSGPSPDGLCQAEAQKRLTQFGPNEIEERKANAFLRFLSYFLGPIPWMIEAALILSALACNFLDAQTVAVLPYEQYLRRFPAYLQQLTMESNGKHVTLDGTRVVWRTGHIYWGEPGTNGQHSFHQLVHQGTKIVPCGFIGFCQALNPMANHHDLLMSNLFAQAEALAFGKTEDEVKDEATPEWLAERATPELASADEPPLKYGSSANALIRRYRRLKDGQL